MDPDDLYGLPLDEFVPQRGALAKGLRADGLRDEAAEVAALRKPSVAAWAVNQLVRTQRKDVQELFAAGDALRDAQSALLAGRGDARELRGAGDRERAAAERLVTAARGLLSSEGHELSAAVIDRVADTLHAAALDEGAREQVREGRLEKELRHVGFGLGEGPAEVPAVKPSKPPKEKPTKGKAAPKSPARGKRDGGAGRDDDAERERAERREQAAARKAARAGETAARRRVERAERALSEAQERHDRAAHALAKADAALGEAQAEAEAALAELESAQRDLKEVGG